MRLRLYLYYVLFFMIMIISLTSCGASQKKIHLFILSGQSNIARLDPEISFAPTVRNALAPDSVIIIKDALSGQPIRRWYKLWQPHPERFGAGEPVPEATGDLYDSLMVKVHSAILDIHPASVTFIWMQGERDARESHGQVYEKSLKGLVKQIETDLNRKDINVIIGRLSDFDMDNKRYPHWTLIRDIQVNTAEQNPFWSWVDTDDYNGPDNDLHYTNDGYNRLGASFAQQALILLNKYTH